MNTPSTTVSPGLGGFIAFFVLAIALWLLMRNMNARIRRMSYRSEQQDAQQREAEQREAEQREAEQREAKQQGGQQGGQQGREDPASGNAGRSGAEPDLGGRGERGEAGDQRDG